MYGVISAACKVAPSFFALAYSSAGEPLRRLVFLAHNADRRRWDGDVRPLAVADEAPRWRKARQLESGINRGPRRMAPKLASGLSCLRPTCFFIPTTRVTNLLFTWSTTASDVSEQLGARRGEARTAWIPRHSRRS
ncbi:hypothetical protein B0T11DRAFT_293039 [Plectosphaerella cucumerina]|uniref:Uncharacterized protein n=1 Tax=Plectosphaerella cucumerina TaxID=40658 RepID=A0A8K0X8G2_9PEZI|nr:hypothetical protein B0T11DRAFT_293039 [Plectosphaerella cucumerina]